jgi:hypothetical protein
VRGGVRYSVEDLPRFVERAKRGPLTETDELIRDALLNALGEELADKLMARRADLAEAAAAEVGHSRLRVGMSLTPIACFAWPRLMAADLAGPDNFSPGTPNPLAKIDHSLWMLREAVALILERSPE